MTHKGLAQTCVPTYVDQNELYFYRVFGISAQYLNGM